MHRFYVLHKHFQNELNEISELKLPEVMPNTQKFPVYPAINCDYIEIDESA